MLTNLTYFISTDYISKAFLSTLHSGQTDILYTHMNFELSLGSLEHKQMLLFKMNKRKCKRGLKWHFNLMNLSLSDVDCRNEDISSADHRMNCYSFVFPLRTKTTDHNLWSHRERKISASTTNQVALLHRPNLYDFYFNNLWLLFNAKAQFCDCCTILKGTNYLTLMLILIEGE